MFDNATDARCRHIEMFRCPVNRSAHHDGPNDLNLPERNFAHKLTLCSAMVKNGI